MGILLVFALSHRPLFTFPPFSRKPPHHLESADTPSWGPEKQKRLSNRMKTRFSCQPVQSPREESISRKHPLLSWSDFLSIHPRSRRHPVESKPPASVGNLNNLLYYIRPLVLAFVLKSRPPMAASGRPSSERLGSRQSGNNLSLSPKSSARCDLCRITESEKQVAYGVEKVNK